MELPTLQQLKCLITYGQEKNFTKAANKMNITQSAFSAQIKKLEDVVGVELIIRSNKGSQFSIAGEELYHFAEGYIFDLQHEIVKIQQETKAAPTVLKVGILRSLGDVLMNRHVQYFKQHEPKMSLAVYDMETSEILTDLHDDRIDIASIYLLQEEPFLDYQRVHFCRDKMVYFAPKIANLSSKVSLEVIEKKPLVYYPDNYFIAGRIKEYLAKAGVKPEMAASLSTPYAMIHYCQQNLAGAILPKRLIEALAINSGWYEIDKPLELEDCLIFKVDNPKIKAINAFVEYICACFNNSK